MMVIQLQWLLLLILCDATVQLGPRLLQCEVSR